MQAQLTQLQHRYHQLDQDKNKNDHGCSHNLCEGFKVVSQLVNDLDDTRVHNTQLEQDQIWLFE